MPPDPHDPSARAHPGGSADPYSAPARSDGDDDAEVPDRDDAAARRGAERPDAAPSDGHAVGAEARERLQALDAALRGTRSRYYAGDQTPDPALEAAVCAAAHALRAEGWPVLAVLRAIKARVDATDASAGRLPRPIAEAAVRWCIAHYFDPAPSPLQSPPPELPS